MMPVHNPIGNDKRQTLKQPIKTYWEGFQMSGQNQKEQTQAARYQMHQHLVALGDDFTIENEQGQPVFKIDGKVLRIRKTLIFCDLQGKTLCSIREKLLNIKKTMEIEGPNGERLAVIQKALISPLRERFNVKIDNGPDLDVQGNILDHEYEIRDGSNLVAMVSKKWFRLSDTYGVTIQPGQNDVLILAVSVAVDMLTHSRK
jgi:uncharacterized protein YxjI